MNVEIVQRHSLVGFRVERSVCVVYPIFTSNVRHLHKSTSIIRTQQIEKRRLNRFLRCLRAKTQPNQFTNFINGFCVIKIFLV